MAKQTIIETTCDICLRYIRRSDEKADIDFGFWVFVDDSDICPRCCFVAERLEWIIDDLIKAINQQRAELPKDELGMWS